MSDEKCSDCREPRVVYKRAGYCRSCYNKRYKRGTLPAATALPVLSIHERVRQAIAVDSERGCWLWRAISRNNYGRISVNNRLRLAHRVSYEAFIGPIPDGLQLDHLCRTPSCVNPWHLEPVTASENTRRSPIHISRRRAAVTHCPSGHPYDADNTYVYVNKGDVFRQCKTCARHRSAARYQPRLGAAANG